MHVHLDLLGKMGDYLNFTYQLIFCYTDDVAGVGVSMLTVLHRTSVRPGTEGRTFYRT
jgi:hypothetical protein